MNMYFVAVVLPPELNKKVLKFKEYMFNKYGSKVGLKSPAHITLVPPFWMEAEKEEQLINDMARNNHVQPFPVITDHFSAFKPRTIFIALCPNEQLNNLKQLTDDLFTNHIDYKVKIDKRPFHPHITIATRDLHKKDFAEAWPWFE